MLREGGGRQNAKGEESGKASLHVVAPSAVGVIDLACGRDYSARIRARSGNLRTAGLMTYAMVTDTLALRGAGVPMEGPQTCQCCRRPFDPARLLYRRGDRVVHEASLLQCDVCERLACPECMRVYDILSGYDFLCHECAREMKRAQLEHTSH